VDRRYGSDDYVGHDPMVPGGTHDGAEMEAHFAPMHEAMSGIEYRIIDIVGKRDHVFHRGELSFVHSGESMSLPPTNERVIVEDHIEWRFEDGALAESWAQYDAVGMMRQLGMEMPGPN
jgi:predicted ester cyclase